MTAEAATSRGVPAQMKDQQGFVLLAVLLVTALIAALATATLVSVRLHSQAVAVEVRLVEAGALAEAGLFRMISALESQEDPLLKELQGSRLPIVWRFAGTEIAVSLSAEAGKVDLNTGDATLVRTVLQGIIKDPAKVAELLARWEEGRRQRKVLESVSSLLSPGDRFDTLAHDMEAAFTTVTAAAGIDPLAASEIVLRHVPGLNDTDLATLEQSRQTGTLVDTGPIRRRLQPLLDGARPLYRLHASVRLSDGIQVNRSALVAQDVSTGKLSIALWNAD